MLKITFEREFFVNTSRFQFFAESCQMLISNPTSWLLPTFYKLNILIVHVTFVFWYLCCAYRCMYYSDFFCEKEKHYQSWSKLRLMKLTMWYIPCCYSNRRTKDPLKHPILGFSHLLGMYQAKFMKYLLKHDTFFNES